MRECEANRRRNSTWANRKVIMVGIVEKQLPGTCAPSAGDPSFADLKVLGEMPLIIEIIYNDCTSISTRKCHEVGPKSKVSGQNRYAGKCIGTEGPKGKPDRCTRTGHPSLSHQPNSPQSAGFLLCS
jgi:hypothetical protein